MAETTLPVEHLCTLTLQTSIAAMLGGAPAGVRVIVAGAGGTFEGEKLKGTIVPPGGDWVTLRTDGSFSLDVRLLLKTEDGADILMTYAGVGTDGGARLRTAPRFETGDERYLWLNAVQGIALGVTAPDSVTYEVYEVK